MEIYGIDAVYGIFNININAAQCSNQVVVGNQSSQTIWIKPFLGSTIYLEGPPPIIPSTHKIEGNVYDYQGNPIDRKVCVFSKTTSLYLGSTISDAVTGFYSVGIASPDPVFVVCFPNAIEDINAKIFDRVVPVVI